MIRPIELEQKKKKSHSSPLLSPSLRRHLLPLFPLNRLDSPSPRPRRRRRRPPTHPQTSPPPRPTSIPTAHLQPFDSESGITAGISQRIQKRKCNCLLSSRSQKGDERKEVNKLCKRREEKKREPFTFPFITFPSRSEIRASLLGVGAKGENFPLLPTLLSEL